MQEYARVTRFSDEQSVNDRLKDGWVILGYDAAFGDVEGQYVVGLPWRVMAEQLVKVLEAFSATGLVAVFKKLEAPDDDKKNDDLLSRKFWVPGSIMDIYLQYLAPSQGPWDLGALKAAVDNLVEHGEDPSLFDGT